MHARLVEILVPDELTISVEALLSAHGERYWRAASPGPREQFACLVAAPELERLLDELEAEFVGVEGFEVIVLETEAVIPTLTRPRLASGGSAVKPSTAIEAFFSRDRLSTDELYDDIGPSIALRPAYLVMVALSAIIAALGMRAGNVAVIIGAMVVAPLLGPAMGMALGSTVGDRRIFAKAMGALSAGALLAVLVTFVMGSFIAIDTGEPELLLRASVKPSDVALALASGAAGVLAFSRGRAISLVGVMIAVALVPPLAAAGVFLAKGLIPFAVGALYLFMTNLVAVNLAGIVTFLLQGLPPKNWRMTGGIIAAWTLILLVFVAALAGWALFGFDPPQLPGL
ncbi:TIGR00341 family protein [Sphingomicrobium sediminis]|uniref:TIGR00341 family protein n=1 Tax=Sphingomicrobium sediminis TaxID=2950949 RepID=A0A9X2EKU4_9SPHN|nr:TIGR00341 family protein [Sphingomicrobium sediminis]MCM8557449.1 TIGR00341 family protein [Sphingomicrobium sediminis]